MAWIRGNWRNNTLNGTESDDTIDGYGGHDTLYGGRGSDTIFGGTGKNPRYPDAPEIPFTVLCNPEIIPIGREKSAGWEGCLSVPGLRGEVPRFEHLIYRGRDAHGIEFEREVDGFHARVVQHESDHLDGVLYPRRVEDMTRFGFTDVLFPAVVA